MEAVLFFLAAIGALGGAIGVVAMRNPFYSVLALIVHLFSLAVLFLLLTAAFVAAAQVVVYAGAVMVLYVFVVAYVGGGGESAWEPIPGQRFLAPLLGVALFVELSIAVLASSLLALDTHGPDVNPRLRRPGRDRPPPPGTLPGPLRGLLDPAPARRGRRSRPRGSADSAQGARVVEHSRRARRGGGVATGPHEHRRGTSSSPRLLFAIGAVGILIRRSPMVILLCLELMLNAGNLALVAFSRMVGNQQGQVFAIVVMVVAACEVVVGLGLIVAIFRRKLPLNVDDLRELRG